MRDPETLSDDAYDVPPPFEGDQAVTLEDFDVKQKEAGFWVLLKFSGANGEQASWSGNFHKSPDTAGRKQNHAISWRGLREFFKALGYGDEAIPACSARAIATELGKLVNVNGDGHRVRGSISLEQKPDGRAYTVISRFRAA